jgi:hypothetical protein
LKLAGAFGLLCVLGAILGVALRHLQLPFINPALLVPLREQMAQAFGALDFVLAVPALNAFIKANPIVGAAIAGAALPGLPLALLLSGRLHDRFLASFDHDVLVPVRAQATADAESSGFVVLHWCEGQALARRAAWEKLHAWVELGSGEGTRWRPRKAARRMFSTAVLVGSSGSGKSRMAGEFARSLARRERLGSASRGRWPMWRAAVWLRRSMPFLSPRQGDPWDAGVVRPCVAGEQVDEYLVRLAVWKPRAPTLLLLDDPGVGRTGDTIRALALATARARHPVRLLVVNQSVPLDSRYSFTGTEWLFDGAPAEPGPILLSQEAWLTDREVRSITFRSAALKDCSEAVRTLAREQLFNVTSGNPLLLELALEWLDKHHDFNGISVAALREQRLQRILEALRVAGVDKPSQLGQLALATLVGGASRTRVEEIAARGAFGAGADLPLGKELQACFPADPLLGASGAQFLPPVRPKLIGEGFVEHVLHVIGQERAGKLLEAAFRLDPAAMLREAAITRPAGSKLAAAFLDLDIGAVVGVDALDWAMAHAELATFVRIDLVAAWTAALQVEHEARAVAAIDRLDGGQRVRFVHAFATRAVQSAEEATLAQLQPDVLLRLVNEATAPKGVDVPLAIWTRLFAAMHDRRLDWAENRIGRFTGLSRAIASAPAETVDAFLDAFLGTQGRWDLVIRELGDLSVGQEANDSEPRHLRLAALFAACSESPVRLNAFVEALARLCRLHPDSEELQHEFVTALRYETRALHRAERAEAACASANRASEVAAAFPQNRAIQYQAICACRNASAACAELLLASEPVSTTQLTDDAAQIAARFPGDFFIRLRWAETVLHHGRANLDAAGTSTAGRTSAEIMAILPDYPESALAAAVLARSLEYECYSFGREGDPEPAVASAAEAAALAERFRACQPIQRPAAAACRSAVYALMQLREERPPEALRALVGQVESIAAFYPVDPQIQLVAAETYGYEASIHAWRPVGSGADAIRAIRRKVLEFAARFPTHAKIHRHLLHCYSCETHAAAEIPLGGGAARAHRCANEAASLAARFPTDEFIQQDIARIFSFDASAWARLPEGAGARNTTIAVERLESHRQTRPKCDLVRAAAVRARMLEAYAWSAVPNGGGAAEARHAADALTRILDGVAGNLELHRQAVHARWLESRSWRSSSDSAAAANARHAANEARRLAEIIPGDLEAFASALECAKVAEEAERLLPPLHPPERLP